MPRSMIVADFYYLKMQVNCAVSMFCFCVLLPIRYLILNLITDSYLPTYIKGEFKFGKGAKVCGYYDPEKIVPT